MFGTDFPMWSASEEMKKINKLDLKDDERELILYKNAERILKAGENKKADNIVKE